MTTPAHTCENVTHCYGCRTLPTLAREHAEMRTLLRVLRDMKGAVDIDDVNTGLNASLRDSARALLARIEKGSDMATPLTCTRCLRTSPDVAVRTWYIDDHGARVDLTYCDQ